MDYALVTQLRQNFDNNGFIQNSSEFLQRNGKININNHQDKENPDTVQDLDSKVLNSNVFLSYI